MGSQKENTNSELSNIGNLFSFDVVSKRLLRAFKKKPYKILYSGLLPKFLRRKIELSSSRNQKDYVADCWRFFIKEYFENKLENFYFKRKKEFNNQNKIIWQYWGQGVNDPNLPEIVQLSFKSIDKFKGDYIVIRLDDNSINDYLDIPDFIFEKRKNFAFKHAFFSDLIRLALLNLYGGVWADATILLTAPISENLLGKNIFMYQRSSHAINKEFWESFNNEYFDWRENNHVKILNSFIIADKENIVVHHCLQILLNFWKTQEKIPDYFFFQIMFDILLNEFLLSDHFEIVDDTLPHLLQCKMNERFNQDEYNLILKKVNVHKMTYLSSPLKNSYYEYLIKIFN